jgi:aspartate-semialdehyde dehydrogenase
MNPDVPLVVPEINFATAGPAQLIANPNCSTIQLVMALAPLQQYYGLARVIVSTYQAVSGSGKQALDQLKAERAGDDSIKAYPHPIDGNCLPHCDAFQEDGYTKEEHKLLNESRKILALPELPLSATAVRVPVMVGHAEAVNVELNAPFELSEVRNLLAQQLGVEVLDEPQQNVYPMPKTAAGRDPVYVGRLRADPSRPNCLNLWVVADNLRKGAATNAIQIAEQLAKAGRFRAASHT